MQDLLCRRTSHPAHITFPEIVITLPDAAPVTIPHPAQIRSDSHLSGSYRSPTSRGASPATYSSPGTPDSSSFDSPASPECITLDSGDQDLGILNQSLDPDSQEQLLEIMVSLEAETAGMNLIQDQENSIIREEDSIINIIMQDNVIRENGFQQHQSEERIDFPIISESATATELLSAVLSVPDEMTGESEEAQVFTQLQNMK